MLRARPCVLEIERHTINIHTPVKTETQRTSYLEMGSPGLSGREVSAQHGGLEGKLPGGCWQHSVEWVGYHITGTALLAFKVMPDSHALNTEAGQI